MDLSSIQPLMDWLMTNQQWVALLLFLVAFLESVAAVGIVIPGVVLLFGISTIAGGGALAVMPALACAFAGAVLGDCLSFFIGKALKERVRIIWPFNRYQEWIVNAELFIDRHGGKSVVIGRFVGPVRPVVPIVAGMLDMSSTRFVLINFLSALAWAPVYVLPGYVVGASLRWGAEFPDAFISLLLIIAMIILMTFLAVKLSHWHLRPDSRLYRLIEAIIVEQHHSRLAWQWLMVNHRSPSAFPLQLLLFFLVALTCTLTMLLLITPPSALAGIDTRIATFYADLSHPLLDTFFSHVNRLMASTTAYALLAGLCAWLLCQRQQLLSALLLMATLIAEIGLGIAGEGEQQLWNPALTQLSFVCCIMSTVVAQPLEHRYTWWLYPLSTLPILLAANAQLYLQLAGLSGVLLSVSLGFVIAAAMLLIHGRYATKPIQLNWWLAAALLASLLIGWLL